MPYVKNYALKPSLRDKRKMIRTSILNPEAIIYRVDRQATEKALLEKQESPKMQWMEYPQTMHLKCLVSDRSVIK